MDRNLKAFVERENIANYIEQIKSESDPVKRKLLAKLLDEESEAGEKRRSVRCRAGVQCLIFRTAIALYAGDPHLKG